METFIAYFDILGFKEFIDNNTKAYVDHHFGNIFRESEGAVSGREYISRGAGVVADLSKSKVNCLHISDSIIFWTKNKSLEDFRNIVDVCYIFNWTTIQSSFPVRGCLVAGDFEFIPYQIESGTANFYNTSFYGKGLVDAYLKADRQDWAGCYIDKTAMVGIEETVIYDLLRRQIVTYYAVPFKDGSSNYEHVFRLLKGPINDLAFRNYSKTFEETFTRHMNRRPLNDSAKRKLNNTIQFLESFRGGVVENKESHGSNLY